VVECIVQALQSLEPPSEEDPPSEDLAKRELEKNVEHAVLKALAATASGAEWPKTVLEKVAMKAALQSRAADAVVRRLQTASVFDQAAADAVDNSECVEATMTELKSQASQGRGLTKHGMQDAFTQVFKDHGLARVALQVLQDPERLAALEAQPEASSSR